MDTRTTFGTAVYGRCTGSFIKFLFAFLYDSISITRLRYKPVSSEFFSEKSHMFYLHHPGITDVKVSYGALQKRLYGTTPVKFTVVPVIRYGARQPYEL